MGALILAGMVIAAAPGASATDAGPAGATAGGGVGTVAPLADPLFGDAFDAELEEQASGFPDPLERVNRGTLRLNRTVDRWVIDPVARAYRFIMPAPARRAVQNFLANLNSPAVLVNDLLQREWTDGGVTATRFAVNTTVGLAGLFDPATRLGYEGHRADFGQTLALEGVQSGPFIMLPILGPTTMRDGAGYLVDILFRPTTYLLGPADQIVYTSVHGGSTGIVTRDANADALKALEESSVDYYVALRNAYYQHRTAQIWERHEREPEPAGGADTAAHAATADATAPALHRTGRDLPTPTIERAERAAGLPAGGAAAAPIAAVAPALARTSER